ncbi:MAG: DUF5611 family protein [Methanoregulaceae archaeon]|nr:DUF5611 family protein [Methanoregulaceae archaeon]
MQEYPVKRSYIKTLKESMVRQIAACFGTKPEPAGDRYRVRYGALKRLEVGLGPGGKTLVVETESDPAAADEIILDTNRRFRKYLEAVTGYTAKERVKMAKTVEKE